jgi:hypothetical protein
LIYAIDRDHSAKASTNAVLNASRSAGLRLVHAIFLPSSGLLLAMLMVYPSEQGATPEALCPWIRATPTRAEQGREATRFPVGGSAGSHNPSGGGADFGTWCLLSRQLRPLRPTR